MDYKCSSAETKAKELGVEVFEGGLKFTKKGG